MPFIITVMRTSDFRTKSGLLLHIISEMHLILKFPSVRCFRITISYSFFISAMRAACKVHLVLLDLFIKTVISWRVEITNLLFVLCPTHPIYFLFLVSGHSRRFMQREKWGHSWRSGLFKLIDLLIVTLNGRRGKWSIFYRKSSRALAGAGRQAVRVGDRA